MSTAQALLADVLQKTPRPEGLGRTHRDALDIRDGLLLALFPDYEIRPTAWDGKNDALTFPIHVVPVGRRTPTPRLIVGADFADWGGMCQGRRIITASFQQVRSYKSAPENWTVRGVTDEFNGRGWKERLIANAVRLAKAL